MAELPEGLQEDNTRRERIKAEIRITDRFIGHLNFYGQGSDPACVPGRQADWEPGQLREARLFNA